ncbi:MAG: TetR/AcrR family transcriptional regulator, partial [Paludibacter sp.]|nr:TetR/AcrR family transcriptional regulator [Paludibacter sp.]
MELREKILNTSTAMFCEYGLKRVSIDDICNELRISKKTFYSIFKQKEE